MEKIFALLNQMETDGIIGPYAIVGVVGTIFWLEPFATRDLGMFGSLPTEAGSSLLSLGPILQRHELISLWQKFQTTYLEP